MSDDGMQAFGEALRAVSKQAVSWRTVSDSRACVMYNVMYIHRSLP